VFIVKSGEKLELFAGIFSVLLLNGSPPIKFQPRPPQAKATSRDNFCKIANAGRERAFSLNRFDDTPGDDSRPDSTYHGSNIPLLWVNSFEKTSFPLQTRSIKAIQPTACPWESGAPTDCSALVVFGRDVR